jgi:hypothetical protein
MPLSELHLFVFATFKHANGEFLITHRSITFDKCRAPCKKIMTVENVGTYASFLEALCTATFSFGARAV